MSRQANLYEKILFDIIKEYDTRFYYEYISRVVDGGQYKIKVEKNREEMVGHAFVTFQNGERIEYEIRYNRLINLTDGYTLVVSGTMAG